MAESSAEVGPASPSARKPSDTLPGGAPDALKEAADGKIKEIDAPGESEVLDFLLGATRPLLFDVPVKFDTPEGQRRLIFVVQQLDGDRILALEKENRRGDGPFAELDDVAANAAIVAESAHWIIDEATGIAVDPKSDRFVGGVPGGIPMAIRTRFKYQSGLLDGVTGQVRSVSGYNPTRVEAANRSIREAAGGS